MGSRLLTLTLVATLFGVSPAHAARDTPKYSSLTVFGDSLVDAGNFFINTNGGYPDKASGYFEGRNTNGYDYTDLLSMKLFGKPTVASGAGGSNYGLGGAHSYEAAGQIGQYIQHLTATVTSADPNGLFVVNFGGNDVFIADGQAPSDGDNYLRYAAQTIADAVEELSGLGARNILVAGFPNPGSPSAATANIYLAQDLAALSLPGATTLLQYNIQSFFDTALQDPASVGLPQLRNDMSCIDAHAQADCSAYFRFDNVHPTAAVDAAMFADMDAKLGLTASQGAVPEPSTWALMLVGFGLVAGAMRFSRRRPANMDRAGLI